MLYHLKFHRKPSHCCSPCANIDELFGPMINDGASLWKY
nr:MAG TPA: hypothetical protein [Caudoviricetes sp.]